MHVTRQADYALRTMLYLARLKQDKRTPTNTMAREQSIPPSFLPKIISQLCVAGLLHTARGAHGGVTLARDPKEISLLQVVEAVDGPIQLNVCVGSQRVCNLEGDCPLQTIWCDAQNELVTRLRNTNFAQLVEQERARV
ncbi:MAG TPA: Rrf2 family transcriptional regulator [Anaerolineales bacterium]|jgi:Rrf2 family protein|nr:Rrf2 family transcriptional regulator [Anaerolineales bacterium]